VLAAAVAGAAVYCRSLTYFFSQDDFLGLARASGLAPRLSGPWRFLSHQALFDLMRHWAGLNPAPYHLVSLASHATCAVLLARFLTRWVSRPAALLASVFFAVHPALFGAVYWISAAGDSLALLFALGALELAFRRDRWRWMAIPLFAASLLAKESTVLLPGVLASSVWLRRTSAGAFGSDRADRAAGSWALTVALAAISFGYLAAFAAENAFGVRDPLPGVAPYAFGLGAHIIANALTYLGWTTDFALPTVQGFTDAADPLVFPWALAGLVLWSVGLASRSLRRRGWFAAGATWLLLLLPVLPLRNHTYHYYLYAPLVGAAWCLAAGTDFVLSLGRRGNPPPRGRRASAGHGDTGSRRAWIVATAGALLLTLNGALLVRKIETMPFVLTDLRAEPVIDRARIARNVQQSLAHAELPSGVELIFWSPVASTLGARGERLVEPAPSETYWERNVREALLDGLAVRVMFPRVEAVRFVREFQPGPRDARYAVYRPDGRLRVATTAEVDSALRAMRPEP
jgi:hypothetical protein